MTNAGHMARPDLPRPTCRVKLVCGPPAAGKTTYVKTHANPDDIVIDLDEIAGEHGLDRTRPESEVRALLQDRNRRLFALSFETHGRVAWVILGAPSRSLRHWWCKTLGVRAHDLIVLVPPREELVRRIINDPERREVRQLHIALVDKWLARERDDNPGVIKRGHGADGYPTDALHPWNRTG